MGHRPFKEAYQQLGARLDSLSVRTPWSETFHEILRELYSVDEAKLIVAMPFRPSSVERISRLSGYPPSRLEPMLDRLCKKGLTVDLWDGKQYRYVVSPLVVGIFEFTMMRTDPGLDRKKISRLFSRYLMEEEAFGAANFTGDLQVSVMRALPYEETLPDLPDVEILDYEKASAIIDEHDCFSVGICSCRHEKFHLGRMRCDVPLETCTSFGNAARYLVRNNLAREISRSEMLDILARSKDSAFTLCADNVRDSVGFICHCCSCCCNLLEGIREKGYDRALTTSNWLADCDMDNCRGCGKCAKACPIDAVAMQAAPGKNENNQVPKVDDELCLGCGACILRCDSRAMHLNPREQRVLHPATSFERIILQCLERGTLQNLVFDEPNSKSHRFFRGLVGGFLRLSPVKKALMGDQLRSRFLQVLTSRNSG